MLNGGDAQSLWRKFTMMHPTIATAYAVLPTYHSARWAFRVLVRFERRIDREIPAAAQLLR
jgi:hypothetical protein